MTTLLAVGSTTASSSDFTIAAGGSATILMYGAASGPISGVALLAIEYKVGSVYVPYIRLDGDPCAIIIDGDPLAATTWRVTRNPDGSNTAAFGVERP